MELKLLNRIFSITTRPAVGALSSAIGPTFANNVPPLYADSTVESLFRNGFGGNATVYTIVSKAASKFGHIPWGVYKIVNEKYHKAYHTMQAQGGGMEQRLRSRRLRRKAYSGQEAINTGKLAPLIARPNPMQGQDSFFEAIMVSYMVAGEAFIWLNRGQVDEDLDDMQVKKLPVLEMYVLPAANIEIIPDRTDPWAINGYYLNTTSDNQNRMFIRKCDVVHWKKINPIYDPSVSRMHLRGLSPLKAGIKLLQQDEDSTDASVAMLQNGGAKAVIFNKDLKGTNPAQDTQLQGVMDRKVNNSKMKASVAAIQGDWGLLNLGMTAVDMQLGIVGEKTFVRLCNLLDVPAALFITDQTYENKSASIKDWLTNSIIPKCCSLRDELNRALLIAFNEPGVVIDNDTSDIPELQEDMGKLVQWLAQMPYLTPNEKREYLNEEQLPGEEMNKIYVPSGLVPIEDLALPDVSNNITPEQQLQEEYNLAVSGRNGN